MALQLHIFFIILISLTPLKSYEFKSRQSKQVTDSGDLIKYLLDTLNNLGFNACLDEAGKVQTGASCKTSTPMAFKPASIDLIPAMVLPTASRLGRQNTPPTGTTPDLLPVLIQLLLTVFYLSIKPKPGATFIKGTCQVYDSNPDMVGICVSPGTLAEAYCPQVHLYLARGNCSDSLCCYNSKNAIMNNYVNYPLPGYPLPYPANSLAYYPTGSSLYPPNPIYMPSPAYPSVLNLPMTVPLYSSIVTVSPLLPPVYTPPPVISQTIPPLYTYPPVGLPSLPSSPVLNYSALVSIPNVFPSLYSPLPQNPINSYVPNYPSYSPSPTNTNQTASLSLFYEQLKKALSNLPSSSG